LVLRGAFQRRRFVVVNFGLGARAGLPGQLAGLAAQHMLPAIYIARDDAGGLTSYGPNFLDSIHLTGTYAGRILNGAKPADLPVQQSTKFEFIINRKTAKTLGLDIPLMLRVRNMWRNWRSCWSSTQHCRSPRFR
jgi:hypothetical protein